MVIYKKTWMFALSFFLLNFFFVFKPLYDNFFLGVTTPLKSIMCNFFKKPIFINSDLERQIQVGHIDPAFLNSFGENPALNLKLQPYPGYLLESLLKKRKYQAVGQFFDSVINNKVEFVSLAFYRSILNTQQQELIDRINEFLEHSSSKIHHNLLLYPIITEYFERLLTHNPSLKRKVMRAWHNISINELFLLHQFLQLKPEEEDIPDFFRGGLFAVQDGGKLKQLLEADLSFKDRSIDCSHPSITHPSSVQGRLIPEFLFGDRNIRFTKNGQVYDTGELSQNSYTWFQTEYASIFGETLWEKIKNWLAHKISYLIYRLSNKNVGPYGFSDHKEGNIKILNHEESLPRDNLMELDSPPSGLYPQLEMN